MDLRKENVIYTATTPEEIQALKNKGFKEVKPAKPEKPEGKPKQDEKPEGKPKEDNK